MAVLVAASPEVVHLAQFARGYTAMLAASFGSLWLLLLLVRTRRARYLPLYALSALVLVASHPFGAVRAGLGAGAAGGAGAGAASPWLAARAANAAGAAGVAGRRAGGDGAAVAGLLAASAQVRRGRRAARWSTSASAEFWRRLGDAWTGSSSPLVGLALAAAALAGLVMLAIRDRRAALILGVWLFQPLLLLAVLTASSSDFAPERHLSFLIPAYTAALAAFLVEIGRRPGRCGPWIAVALTRRRGHARGGGAVRRHRHLHARPARRQPLPGRRLRRTATCCCRPAACPRTGVDARLYGAYAALEAPDGDPLSQWRDVGKDTGCDLVARLDQRPQPQAAWVMLRSPDPAALPARLDALGFDRLRTFGPFVVGRAPAAHVRRRRRR